MSSIKGDLSILDGKTGKRKKRRAAANQVSPAGSLSRMESSNAAVSWSTLGSQSSWTSGGADEEVGQLDANFGTLFWAAPEVLRAGSVNATHASDAYALGVVLWELATRSDPYPGENPVAVAMEV